eukprot:CAMPEP_0198648292 /NCGR_PEP_ID=MMETSP1467-20131203/3380_1 /TAXON_ID=1462469 /ORGANISM="unid. sp., Strain CCMP2135" /LENGTH=702 /DNA_ID=CAMNT_0044384003 /DNA_START=383 /DNA_END=2491 /DNA_ORIENTATION=-
MPGVGNGLGTESKSDLSLELKIGFVGNFGLRMVTPRQLRSTHLGEHVCVVGIITHCSLAAPKVLRSVHWDSETQKHVSKEFRDSSSLDSWIEFSGTSEWRTGDGMPSNDSRPILPRMPSREHRFRDTQSMQAEFGLGQYADHQVLTLQELPEAAPLGELPRSVDVIVEDDLVDSVKPGDRVSIAGVYRAMPSSSLQSVMFRAVLLANSVSKHNQESRIPETTVHDVTNENLEESTGTHEDSKLRDIMSCPALSIFARSVHGLDIVKFALIMQLVGGCEKILASGSRLRGDINILLLGDPSTAKSQLLRATMRAAPLAISTTGRGSSGVGLTAAVCHDRDTGESRLQAGATVLADRGLVCIDEFDKMPAGDRVAIHEVMEQQTVTLAKAGIYASLNARCAILAAANPIYGQYDSSRRPQENIGLPDSLLSRFDLIFIILDNIEPKPDQNIAEHVLQLHRAGNDNNTERACTQTTTDAEHHMMPDDSKSTANGTVDGMQREHRDDTSLKQYVSYVRDHATPLLRTDARNSLANGYAEIRAKADEHTLPVTARCLESLIRLATARAKLRFSDSVTISDCTAAFDLVTFALSADSTTGTKDGMDMMQKAGLAEKQVKDTVHNAAIPDSENETQDQAISRKTRVMDLISRGSPLARTSMSNLVDQVNATRASHELEYTSSEIEVIVASLAAENLVLYDELDGTVLTL